MTGASPTPASGHKQKMRPDTFACSCGFVRPVSIPVDVPIERWLADYPCPACATVLYPRGAMLAPTPVTAVEVVYLVLRALTDPDVRTLADLDRRTSLPSTLVLAAVDKISATGLSPQVDALIDAEFGADGACQGCGASWPGREGCGACAEALGWHL